MTQHSISSSASGYAGLLILILNGTNVKEYHFKVNNNMESALRRVQIRDKR